MASGDDLGALASQATLNEIKDNLGSTDDTDGTIVTGTVNAKLNAVLDTTGQQKSKLDTVLTILGSGTKEFKSAGNYSVEIPAGITKLTITACGGGGGGGNQTSSNYGSAGGGGGGAAIVDKVFTLPESISATTLSITVGAGGSSGNAGGSTVIGDLITLAGGKAGASTINGTSAGGSSGGTGGGAGGSGTVTTTASTTVSSNAGQNGVTGKGGSGRTVTSVTGNYPYAAAGGGGGGSLGNGGSGAAAVYKNNVTSTPGTRGGGGGGGAHVYHSSYGHITVKGSSGGAGYVKIVWGL